MKKLLLSILMLGFLNATAQAIIPLYPDGKVPNAKPVSDQEEKMIKSNGDIVFSKVSVPTLEIWLPEKTIANGTAVVICPGGGYTNLQYTHEGTSIAKKFNKMGVAAFILKYRMPSDDWMIDKTIGPLQDAQQALKTVRMRATEWAVDTARVGIIGFSAGGHLASTAGTHFYNAVIPNVQKISLRPSFMILVYPVINLTDSLMHKGSRDNLLGLTPSIDLITAYSNDLQVEKDTPPAFITHAEDDKKVKVANSINMYMALMNKGVMAEMHIYPKGGHGFSSPQNDAVNWMYRCRDWMRSNGWVK